MLIGGALWDSEQEHLRDHESSDVDDRKEHEIYVHPFMRAVQAGVASVMCSYSASPCSSQIVTRKVLSLRGRSSECIMGMRERPDVEPDPEG